MVQGPTSPFQDPEESFDNSPEIITQPGIQNNGEFSFESGSEPSRSPMPTPKLNVASPSLRFNLPHNTKNTHNNSQEGTPQSPFLDTIILNEENAAFSNETVTKRHRWGTTRNKHGRPKKESVGRSKTLRRLLNPNHAHDSDKKRYPSIKIPNRDDHAHNDSDDNDDENTSNDPRDRKAEKRSVVFNRSLPEEFTDPETGKSIMTYPRNKIRTTKYTPLTFLPKNISHQFLHNIANIYFLVLIILGAFEIFGVPSPILAAVPLIVIVIITAFKDAVEDSRRTITDMEVNNQETHILVQNEDSSGDYQYANINVCDEKVSLWRRFKKWNTRLLFGVVKSSKRNLTKSGRAQKAREKANQNIHDDVPVRKSFDSARSPRPSSDNPFSSRLSTDFRASFDFRRSMQSRRSGTYHSPKVLKFARKYWKDVHVGDVLRIYNNDEIPADLIILATSDEDNCCYVETKNLDGETNLKVRQALKYTSIDNKIKRADDLLNHSFQIDSEGPHPNLYSYQANLKYYDEDNQEGQEPININNILLRGCSLRNTKWVIGVVAFTGDDTKIMLNAGITPTKQSRISRELNYYVLLNFVLLFIICFVSGLVNGIWYRKKGTSRDFYEFGTVAGTPAKNGIVDFFVALILYQSLVPISLYITIEIIKTAQAYFIYSDNAMYYERLDYPCTPKSWSISDDLGQIEYVFSDKTGTLTQNLMEFKKCTINGVSYGRAYTEALAGLRKRQGIDTDEEGARERALIAKDKDAMIEKLINLSPANAKYQDEISFVSSEFVDDLNGAKGEQQQKCNSHFMLALALCHSVLVEEDPKQPGRMVFKAQSPDESALVGTARSVGYNFKGSTKKGVLIESQGVTKEYQILNTLEFNSTRKRMSAIVKIPGENGEEPKALLICKGADSIIYSRLSKSQNVKNLLDQTSDQLEEFATEGLRTLCIAQRELSWDQYTEWNKRHQAAASSLDNREEQMEAVADSIERELILLGGTAIEDRLQDGVPDAIQTLGQAGIKLWVLTGDKVETAINIGFSCNLLGNDMELLLLKTKYTDTEIDLYGIDNHDDLSSAALINQMIDLYLKKYFEMSGSVEELDNAIGDHSPPNNGFAIVIDGTALKLALEDKETSRKFLLLCKQCRSVLCCRVSPAQKAAVVKLVKDTLDVMTLAIGDGSNDVAMIQAADVGVGIAGEEGRQAVMSSDYAFGQFRFLAKLLLVHGRWSYKRFSEMIPLFFYKNVIFTIALFWYGIYCNYDGTYLFEFTYLMFYNLAFTSLPVIFLGVFDQDVSSKVSLLVPQLYGTGILRIEWTDAKFWWYMVDAIYQSVISFFFPYLVFYVSYPNSNGLPLDHRFYVGIYVTCIACISCNFYMLFHQYRWDWLSSLIVAISILIIYIWTGLWTVNTYAGEFYKAAPHVFGTLSFWVATFIGVLCSLIPRFFYDILQKLYWPKDVDIIRECVQLGQFDAYPEDYDPTDPNKVRISEYSGESNRRISMGYQTKPPSSYQSDLESSPMETALKLPESKESYKNISSSGSDEFAPEPQPEQADFEPVDNPRSNHLTHRQHSSVRNSVQSKYYDNGSVLDMYKHINNTQDDVTSSLQVEEIPLEDFGTNFKQASRISSETRRLSQQYRGH